MQRLQDTHSVSMPDKKPAPGNSPTPVDSRRDRLSPFGLGGGARRRLDPVVDEIFKLLEVVDKAAA